ncbi:3'-5' exoribonuclease YhaM family protein [Desulfitobacterium metallireducens]|uniref:Phosphohydrolase n=1 Tax=Desulfitobacterium metallireducens DSM 15288 TaxID=871968 RepID=W0E6L6_9FIRM|nr:HD domain-containing protein [Desulfitobacterium metallireducens]AHF06407.1 phosphohydrolase [Desulfitobacterium metallireducens DSM 15288]
MIQDLKAGERYQGILLITDWKEATFRNKPGSYLILTCQDCTGSIGGKVWEMTAQMSHWLQEFDVFEMKGQVNEFRGNLELSIDSLQPVPEDKIELTELLQASPESAGELEKRLKTLVQEVEDPYLNLLIKHILEDPKIGKAYRSCPAARKIHQAYLRGLWEHSVEVAELAASLASHYPEVDRDLTITGALLHDLGKISEYEYARGIDVTTEGRLLGHIVLGIQMVTREIDMILGFPVELKTKLMHILASHHGRYEWQSPKRPKIMEALLVHYADAMEAELWQFKHAKGAYSDSEWSPYLPSMERYLYLK